MADETPERRRSIRRWLVVGVIWATALAVVTIFIAYDAVVQVFETVKVRVRLSSWAWPLAIAAAATVAVSTRARQRWPSLRQRALLAVVVFAVLYVPVAAFGAVRAMLILGLATITALLAAWALILPRRLAPPVPAEVLSALPERDRVELADGRIRLRNDLRATALQTIAGLALLAGTLAAFQQLSEDRRQATDARELTTQGQASERFTRAVTQLGSERLEVRLGGIYGLEQIARQAPDNRHAVTEVLVAYLHRRSPVQGKGAQPVEKLGVRAPDVQATLAVLVRRQPWWNDPPLNLSNLDLRGAEISGQFTTVNDRVEILEGDLRYANFGGSDLRGATISDVYLAGADLSNTDLRGTDLKKLGVSRNCKQARSTPDGTGACSDVAPLRYPQQLRPPKESLISGVRLKAALVDASTGWPPGFDWRAAGAKEM